VAAIILLDERPSALALCGILLIVTGVFFITREPGSMGGPGLGKGVADGLATGGFIAAYTLWDKQAVGVLMIPPLLQDWSSNVVRTAILSPLALRNWGKVREMWRAHKPEVLGVAVLTPLAYILVLTALVFTPVSYVAPAREISILIGVLMGASLLAEGNVRQRLLAAGAMVLGIVALALG